MIYSSRECKASHYLSVHIASHLQPVRSIFVSVIADSPVLPLESLEVKQTRSEITVAQLWCLYKCPVHVYCLYLTVPEVCRTLNPLETCIVLFLVLDGVAKLAIIDGMPVVSHYYSTCVQSISNSFDVINGLITTNDQFRPPRATLQRQSSIPGPRFCIAGLCKDVPWKNLSPAIEYYVNALAKTFAWESNFEVLDVIHPHYSSI
jgi:hypothetical protein